MHTLSQRSAWVPAFGEFLSVPHAFEVCAIPGKNYRFFKKKLLGSFDESALRGGILFKEGSSI